MIVDSTLKLTQNDWIKEQMEDTDIGKITQLLKNQQAEHICGSRNGFFKNTDTLDV